MKKLKYYLKTDLKQTKTSYPTKNKKPPHYKMGGSFIKIKNNFIE
jgi:hypothetical protein